MYVFAICLLMLAACIGRGKADNEAAEVNGPQVEEPAPLFDPARARAVEIASSLDDRLLAAQALICGIDGRGFLPPHMKTLLEECPAGGVVLFRYNLDTAEEAIRSLLTQTAAFIRDESGLPPFIAVDHEGVDVNRFRPGAVPLPAAVSYWELAVKEGKLKALEKIEFDSFNAGQKINSFGINLNFAPVAEYLTADNRDFLDSRSYGPDPLFTAEASSAFIRGMERAGVLCAVKHFPGSAGPDPHLYQSVLNGDKADLDRLVSPFTALIKSGARAVMVAHSLVPAMDSEIASLSKVIMEDWLRGEMGFKGIIICDDFSMAAASGQAAGEEAAIRSVAAGADMVLVWPPDIRRTHRAFVLALEEGRLSRERLREAAERIIYEKITMGLIMELEMRSEE